MRAGAAVPGAPVPLEVHRVARRVHLLVDLMIEEEVVLDRQHEQTDSDRD
jgi:hypothetical protein